MSDRFGRQSEEHPPSSVLLLHIEGELDGREAASVRRHLADCWDCRVRREELEEGIHAYVVARRDVLIPHLLPPPPSRHNFIPRLHQEIAKTLAPPRFERLAILLRRSFAAPPRAAWFTGGVSLAMALAIFYVYVANPPTITAAAFFERIHRADEAGPLAEHYVAVQKVQLWQGNRAVERQVIHEARRPVRRAAQSSHADALWARSLTAAQIDWDDPLNVDRFESWHDSQSASRDRVTQTKDAVTLTTCLKAGEPVLLASLTVSSADWHPIAERFEFSHQPPLEVRELSYEIRNETAPAAPINIAANRASALASPAKPSDADLERSEIGAREALHRLDADRNELPEIVRENHHLAIRATAESTERKQQLMAIVKGIPYVKSEIAGTTSATGIVTATAPPRSAAPHSPPSYSTTPPLANALWDYKGGMDAANNYLDVVRESYFRALADANALDRLAHRYSGAEWNRLPPDVQMRVNRLAADYIQAIQKNTPEYLRQLSDPLDEMLRQNNISLSPLAVDANASCEPWQSLAPRIVADLRQTQTSFRRLFVVDQTDAPLDVSADTLLPAVVQRCSRVNHEMRSLCPP
jgi:hypothetical protein